MLQEKESNTVKTSARGTAHECTFQGWSKKLRITKETVEEMLDARKIDGMIVYEAERPDLGLNPGLWVRKLMTNRLSYVTTYCGTMYKLNMT
jgi:hypothetical protein